MNIRRKYSFMDYTEQVRKSEKLIELLKNETTASIQQSIDLQLSTILLYFKWYAVNQKKLINKTIPLDGYFYGFCGMLDILVDCELLHSYEQKYAGSDIENSYFRINVNNLNLDFHKQLEIKGYYPLEGTKQTLTQAHLDLFDEKYAINYQEIISNILKEENLEYTILAAKLATALDIEFVDKYDVVCNRRVRFYETPNDSFNTIFHAAFEENFDLYDNEFIEDRVIVIYGYSKEQEVNRKKTAYYLSNHMIEKWTDKETDRGHFIAHSIGGELNSNIYPQSRSFNQNKTEKGKLYRRMEDYARKHKGTYCFSRPVYFDFSTRPYLLEYGVLKKDNTLWVERFVNV